MKKKVAVVVLVLLFAVGIIIYRNTREASHFMVPTDKFNFAQDFNFAFQLVVDGEYVVVNAIGLLQVVPFAGRVNDLVFVHSLEEAKGFPSNVMVAWPFRLQWTEGAIARLHMRVDEHENLSLEEFGLTYPITITDLVDNWEKVSTLLDSFVRNARAWILSPETDNIDHHRDPTVMSIEAGGIECNIDEERLAMIEKFNYALALRFRFMIAVDGQRILSDSAVRSRIDPNSPDFNPFYVNLVLVTHEVYTDEIPASVISAWPMEWPFTRDIIGRIHDAVNKEANDLTADGEALRDVITLEDFELSYPITSDDLVDNWQKVNALWNALHPSEQEAIRHIDYLRVPTE